MLKLYLPCVIIVTGSADFGSGVDPYNLMPTNFNNKGSYILKGNTININDIIYYFAGIDADYTSGPYHVTFTPGDMSIPFSIPLIDDDIFEGNETFTLAIVPSDSISISDGTAIVTIVDNEGEC